MFYLLILIGLVKPQGDNLYAFFTPDGQVFEYAYREEIKQAIYTKEFKYNEDLHFTNN
tara:strand:+ start:11097 stop:11270 length:174 start_codon:yes stop_codon:yes gene_type:complete